MAILKNKKWHYIFITLGLTWLLQFIPIFFHLNVEETSLTSFDFSSVFFVIGGMIPSLVAVLIVLFTCNKREKKDYFKRCLTISPRNIKWIFVAPYSEIYGFILVPVSIVMDILLFIIVYKSKRFQQKLAKQVQQID